MSPVFADAVYWVALLIPKAFGTVASNGTQLPPNTLGTFPTGPERCPSRDETKHTSF